MRVTPMSAGDLSSVIGLESLAFKNPWGMPAFIGELACNNAYNFVLRSPEHRLIAYICLRLIVNELHVLKIAVNDAYRQQGIASQFFSQCLAEIPEAFDLAFLEVRPANLAGIRLYRKLGFVLWGRRPGYYLHTGQDALIMGKIFKGGSYGSEDSD